MNYKLNGLLFNSARKLGVTRTEFWTLQGIANFANEQTGACFPSTAQISNATLLNERTIRIAIQSLEKKGLLSTKQKPGGKRYFTFAVEKIKALQEEEPLQKVTPLQETTGGQKVTGGQKLTPVPLQKLTGEGGRILPGTPAETYPRTENITENIKEKVNREVIGRSAEAIAPPQTTSSSEPTLFDLAKKGKTSVATMLTIKELPPSWRLYCKTKRPELDPDTTFVDFQFYWQAQGAKKMRNWEQTWQGWVRRQGNVPVRTADRPADVSVQTWNDFLATRKSPFTETALKQLLMEVAKCPDLTLEQALIYTVGKGWKTFDAGYYKQNKSYSTEDEFSLTDLLKRKKETKQ